MSKHPYEDVGEIAKDAARAKAEFCLATGVAPSEYDNLTQYEIEAFVREANRRASKSK